jgi:hypothetical protein
MKQAYGSCSISLNLNFSMSYSIINISGPNKSAVSPWICLIKMVRRLICLQRDKIIVQNENYEGRDMEKANASILETNLLKRYDKSCL